MRERERDLERERKERERRETDRKTDGNARKKCGDGHIMMRQHAEKGNKLLDRILGIEFLWRK